MSNYIQHKNSTVAYEVWGHGAHVLLAFHGFGQKPSVFKVFQEFLREQYTVISIALWGHGESRWQEENPPTPADVQNIISRILSQEKVTQGPWSILSFSIGSRLALACLVAFPQKIQKAVLIAPVIGGYDGLYRLATRTTIGQSLFKQFIAKPQFVLSLMNIAAWLRLVHPTAITFAKRSVASQAQRQQIWETWHALSHLTFTVRGLKKALRDQPLALHFITGTNDRITPAKTIRKWTQQLPQGELHQVSATHKILDPAINNVLKKALSIK